MKIEVSMTTEKQEMYVHSWWARDPEFVVKTLQAHLLVGATVWPELDQYQIVKKRSRSKATMSERGVAGGNARALALSDARRAEIAANAANARWGNKEQR